MKTLRLGALVLLSIKFSPADRAYLEQQANARKTYIVLRVDDPTAYESIQEQLENAGYYYVHASKEGSTELFLRRRSMAQCKHCGAILSTWGIECGDGKCHICKNKTRKNWTEVYPWGGKIYKPEKLPVPRSICIQLATAEKPAPSSAS